MLFFDTLSFNIYYRCFCWPVEVDDGILTSIDEYIQRLQCDFIHHYNKHTIEYRPEYSDVLIDVPFYSSIPDGYFIKEMWNIPHQCSDVNILQILALIPVERSREQETDIMERRLNKHSTQNAKSFFSKKHKFKKNLIIDAEDFDGRLSFFFKSLINILMNSDRVMCDGMVTNSLLNCIPIILDYFKDMLRSVIIKKSLYIYLTNETYDIMDRLIDKLMRTTEILSNELETLKHDVVKSFRQNPIQVDSLKMSVNLN